MSYGSNNASSMGSSCSVLLLDICMDESVLKAILRHEKPVSFVRDPRRPLRWCKCKQWKAVIVDRGRTADAQESRLDDVAFATVARIKIIDRAKNNIMLGIGSDCFMVLGCRDLRDPVIVAGERWISNSAL
jgi:hypothetical protein